MTKAERLIYIVNMIRQREAVTLKEMAASCGVSPRSIYRDLSALTRMNIPVYYRDGYRLQDDNNIPVMELSDSEVELICYALRNNPISRTPFFDEKFRSIEGKIAVRKYKTPVPQSGNFFVFDSIGRTEIVDESPYLSTFLRAISEGRTVMIATDDGGHEAVEYTPVAVKISGTQPHFLVKDNSDSGIVSIASTDVRSLVLTDRKFQRRRTTTVESAI